MANKTTRPAKKTAKKIAKKTSVRKTVKKIPIEDMAATVKETIAGCRPESLKGKVGCPTVYNPLIHPYQAYVACADMDATQKEVAVLFGVEVKAIYEWQRMHEEFAYAIKKGTYESNNKAALVSLRKLVAGYAYEETTKEIMPDGSKHVKIVTKHIPPSLGAVCWWQKNRLRDEWKDYKAVELGTLDNKPWNITVKLIDEDEPEDT